MEPPAATFLDIILYSREQIRKENLSTGDATADTDAPWGIISVKVLGNTVYFAFKNPKFLDDVSYPSLSRVSCATTSFPCNQ